MAPKREPEIVGFFAGGNIPLESVGHVLKVLYERGEGGFQLDPVFEKPEPRAKISQTQPPDLPGPNGAHVLPPPAAPSTSPDSVRRLDLSVRDWLIALIRQGGIDREAIGQHAERDGMDKRQVTTRLWEMQKHNELKTVGRLFQIGNLIEKRRVKKQRASTIARRQAAVVNAQPAVAEIKLPSEASQEGITLAALRKAHPDTMSYADMKEHFRRLKRRPVSAGVALTVLVKRGLIERPAPGIYRYIPRPTTKQPA